MPARSIQPAVKLFVAGREYSLVFSFEGIAKAEDAFGLSLITGIGPKDLEAPSVPRIASMLYGALRAFHSEIGWEQAKKLLTVRNHAGVWAKVLEAWMASMAEPETGDAVQASAAPPMTARQLWDNLWSHARHDLGIQEAEFWQMTPRQLDLLSRRHRAEREWAELQQARLMAVVVNYSFCAPKEPVSAADFMLSLKPSEREEISEDLIAARFEALFAPVAVVARPN